MKKLFLCAAALAALSMTASTAVIAGEVYAKADISQASTVQMSQKAKSPAMTLLAGRPGGLKSHTVKGGGGGKGHR